MDYSHDRMYWMHRESGYLADFMVTDDFGNLVSVPFLVDEEFEMNS